MKHMLMTAVPDPLMEMRQARQGIYVRSGGKRAFDILGALALLFLLSPIIAIFWVLVRRRNHSGFYAQWRIGKGGEPFRCWKLRSMRPNADADLVTYLRDNPQARAEWDQHRKLRNDPRVTGLGRFIRKTSIDELPQLWNVLRGDMSLVGPRPVPAEELTRYGYIGQAAYHSVRPGITGLWQVSGRNDVSYEARVQFDIEYCANISVSRDVLILLKTLFVVAQVKGL